MRLYLQALAAMKPRGSWKRVGTAVASKYPVQTRIQAPSRGQYLYVEAAMTVSGLIVAARWTLPRQNLPNLVKITASVTKAFAGCIGRGTGYVDLISTLSDGPGRSGPACATAMYDAVSSQLRDLGERYVR